MRQSAVMDGGSAGSATAGGKHYDSNGLGTRVLDSAAGLARSTLAARGGMENSLRDLQSAAGKERGLTRPSDGLEGSHFEVARWEREGSPASSSSSSSSSSFRTGDERERTKVVEREFEAFETAAPSVDWMAWDLAGESAAGHRLISEATQQLGGETFASVLNDSKNKMKWDEEFRIPSKDSLDLDSNEEQTASVPLKRLQQIRSHLAYTTGAHQIHADGPSCAPLPPTAAPAATTTSKPHTEQLSSRSLDDFACPCTECHYMLALHNAGMLPASECVHDGCGEELADPQEWLEHVLSAHHGGRGAMGEASPAWSDYDSERAQYFGEHW